MALDTNCAYSRKETWKGLNEARRSRNQCFGLSCVSKHGKGKEMINGAKSKRNTCIFSDWRRSSTASREKSIIQKIPKGLGEGLGVKPNIQDYKDEYNDAFDSITWTNDEKSKTDDDDSHVEDDQTGIKSFNTHEHHHTLYKALMNSMSINKIQARGEPTQPSHKKHSHDDHDPLGNCEGENTKRRCKNIRIYSSKKGKAHQESSNYETFVDANEPQQERECYLAMSDKIDWVNLEGNIFYNDLGKSLPLVGPPGRKTIPTRYIFNNDLEYLKHENKEKKYAISLSKLYVLREKIVNGSTKETLMSQQNIKSSQGSRKVHHLDGVDEFDMINALLLYIRRIVIKKMVGDAQFEVESYQTKLNRTKPQFFKDAI
nr:hypothetical protein [Tanacetum cinerariifolium]